MLCGSCARSSIRSVFSSRLRDSPRDSQGIVSPFCVFRAHLTECSTRESSVCCVCVCVRVCAISVCGVKVDGEDDEETQAWRDDLVSSVANGSATRARTVKWSEMMARDVFTCTAISSSKLSPMAPRTLS